MHLRTTKFQGARIWLLGHWENQSRRLAADNEVSYVVVSSRGRHTRSLCDWSSDVCSSDLDSSVVLAGDTRGDRAEGPRRSRGGAQAAEPADQEARRLRRAGAGDPRDGLQESRGLLHRARIGRASCREREESWVAVVA